MQKPIIINNVDGASLFTRYGYTVTYKKVFGNAGGTMLDGSTTEDVIAIKAVISLTPMPMTESRLTGFVALLYSKDYAVVTYYDPKVGKQRTIETMYSEVVTKHRMQNAFGDEIWTVEQLTLTER